MKINWLWDTRLSENRIKSILKDEKDPRFYIYAEKLFSRVNDPKVAFTYISREIFRKAWPNISKRVEKDTWAKERLVFWQSFYEKASTVSPERMSVAEQIREIRIRMGYTQKEMAEKLGVIQQFISKMETGRENLTIDTLKRIAEILDKKLMIHLN